jgi:hypothetical protein
MLQDTLDGETLRNLDQHDPSPRELIGLVDMGDDPDELDTEGTILEPEHEVWAHGPKEWVQSVSDAEQQIEKALRTLSVEGIFKTSTMKSRGGKPVEMRVTVEDIE